jgi:hypothetical protein
MPTEVKTKPSESHPPKSRGIDKHPEHDPKAAAHKVTQQQQQHREALRLALGSILSPRPPLSSSHSSSGTTTPSYPFSIPSGPHTPSGTPPSYYPLAHGPNSSEYIHSLHPHFHHPHPHTPSRLGRSKSSSTNSPSGSAPSSSHPSPLPPGPVPSNLPIPPEIEPLPPAQVTNGVIMTTASPLPTRPPNTPLHANGNPPIPSDHPSADSADHAARAGTPRSKFMQTLQSKSAWDALIHGSFS